MLWGTKWHGLNTEAWKESQGCPGSETISGGDYTCYLPTKHMCMRACARTHTHTHTHTRPLLSQWPTLQASSNSHLDSSSCQGQRRGKAAPAVKTKQPLQPSDARV